MRIPSRQALRARVRRAANLAMIETSRSDEKNAVPPGCRGGFPLWENRMRTAAPPPDAAALGVGSMKR